MSVSFTPQSMWFWRKIVSVQKSSMCMDSSIHRYTLLFWHKVVLSISSATWTDTKYVSQQRTLHVLIKRHKSSRSYFSLQRLYHLIVSLNNTNFQPLTLKRKVWVKKLKSSSTYGLKETVKSAPVTPRERIWSAVLFGLLQTDQRCSCNL